MALGLRAVTPAQVDEILVECRQFDAAARQRVGGLLLPRQRVHARVVADAPAIAEALAQPARVRLVDQVEEFEQLLRHLLAHLHGVAAIDEDRRRVGEHDHHARRAGEAADPAQPLVAFRNVFAEVFIGARHDQRVETALAHLLAHRVESFCDRVH